MKHEEAAIGGDTLHKFETVRGVDWDLLILLPDLGHFLYWYVKDGKHFLQANERTYGPYDCLAYPSVSVEGGTFGFKYNVGGKVERFSATGGEWWVRIAGVASRDTDRTYGPYELVADLGPGLSADGKAFAFRFLMDGRAYVQAGDWAYGSYDHVPFLRLGKDGRHVLFSYQREGEWYVRDGECIDGEFDDVYFGNSTEGTSLNQARFAYRKGDKYYVRLGGKDHGPYTGLNPHSLAFRSDGASFVFWYNLGGKIFFQTESRTYGGFQAAGPYCGFGGAGNELFFGYKEAESWYFRLGDAIFGPYDFLWGAPVFCRNGKEFGFTCKKGEQFFVRVGDREYGPFERVDGLCLSACGTRHAFAYWKGGAMYAQVDDSTYGPYEFAAVDSVFQNPFSPGEESFCFYYTQDKRHYVRFNEAVYGPFEYALNPQMSPDGKSVAVIHNVGGREGYETITGGRWYVQINDRAYDCSDEVAFKYKPDGSGAAMVYLSDGVIHVRNIQF